VLYSEFWALYIEFWALLQKCMGSGASIHVEPYLDNDTASLSDESTADDESMDTVNMSDESSDNESLFI